MIMNIKTATAALALGLSLSVVPVAAFAATPTTNSVATPSSVSTTQAPAERMVLKADQTTVNPFQRVNFTVNSTMTGSGVLYQNGKPAPNVHPIPITKGQIAKFYYEPGMTGTYYVKIGNSLQSNSVVVNVR